MVRSCFAMNFFRYICLGTFLVPSVACIEGLQEIYELQDTRILGLEASPPEILFDVNSAETVTIKPVVYLPEGVTITSASWSFCPFAAGGELGYRCFLEQCVEDVSDLVNSDGNLEIQPVAKAFECFQGLSDEDISDESTPSLDADQFDQLSTQVRFTVESSDGAVREAVKRIPVWVEEPEVGLNRNPALVSISVGGQVLTPGAPAVEVQTIAEGSGDDAKVSLPINAVADPSSFDQYVSGEEVRREDAQWSVYITVGELGTIGNRLVGDEAQGEWSQPASEESPSVVEMWISLRDGRTGQAVSGPYLFTPLR